LLDSYTTSLPPPLPLSILLSSQCQCQGVVKRKSRDGYSKSKVRVSSGALLLRLDCRELHLNTQPKGIYGDNARCSGTVMSSLAVESPRKTIGLEERVHKHKLLRLIEDASVGHCPAQPHCTNQASKAYLALAHTCKPRTMPPSCLPLLYASHRP
jgi:hypothetical protein